MSDFLGGLCVLGLAWIFGAWCAHPVDDDIYIGKTSGYTCADPLRRGYKPLDSPIDNR